jgi:hypothetical protein
MDISFDLSALAPPQVTLTGVKGTADILAVSAKLLQEVLEPAAAQLSDRFDKHSKGRKAKSISFTLSKGHGFVICVKLTIVMQDGEEIHGQQNLSCVDIRKKTSGELIDLYLKHAYEAAIFCLLQEKTDA